MKSVQLLILMFCLLILSFAQGQPTVETIYLKDGTVIKGQIVSSDETSVKVRASFGEITISKADIQEIKYATEAWTEQNDSNIQQRNTDVLAEYEGKKLKVVRYNYSEGAIAGPTGGIVAGRYESGLDWAVIQGESGAPISDLDLLQLTGHPEKIKEIKSRLKTYKALLVVAGTMFVGGMVIWMGPGVQRLDEREDPSLFITGLSIQLASLLLEVGCIKKLTVRHHISGKYANDLVYEYNAALGKRLGVSINMNF